MSLGSTEPNGEGLGFEANGQGYFTISEGFNPSIYYFPRTDSGKPRVPTTFIPPGSTWRYLDDGTDQDVPWQMTDFDDSFWPEGAGQFGYGQGDEQTLTYFGYDFAKITTTYFRKQFTINSLAGITNVLDAPLLQRRHRRLFEWKGTLPAQSIGRRR